MKDNRSTECRTRRYQYRAIGPCVFISEPPIIIYFLGWLLSADIIIKLRGLPSLANHAEISREINCRQVGVSGAMITYPETHATHISSESTTELCKIYWRLGISAWHPSMVKAVVINLRGDCRYDDIPAATNWLLGTSVPMRGSRLLCRCCCTCLRESGFFWLLISSRTFCMINTRAKGGGVASWHSSPWSTHDEPSEHQGILLG